MEFQTLKKDNKKKWIIGSILIIVLTITITFIGTRAKYKSTAHTTIAKGIINYNYDLNLVAVNIQNNSGEYVSVTDVPTSGYTLNKEKSYCKVGDEKVNVPMEYKGKVYIGTNKKGTKCELFFDKGVFKTKDLILSRNIIDTSRASGSFTSAFEEDTNGRIFSSIDDDGETYFFAGYNPNNWVKFGTNKDGQDLYWRIIRINGDESIRVIYNGPTTDQTGETTSIGNSKFNEYFDDNTYVGYMYGTPGSNTYAATHTNINSSTIKKYLDTWYEENLKTNYGKYIDTNAGFCGDKIVTNFDDWAYGDGSGTTYVNYVQSKRNWNTFTSTYKCENKGSDLYTLNESTKGNKALINPIGLITSDEAYYAGGYYANEFNYWLNTEQSYWTISPGRFYRSAGAMTVQNGRLSLQNVNCDWLYVRPVINLKEDTLKIGSGTTTDPYRLV